MANELLDEIRKLHDQIHANDPTPSSRLEHQAASALSGFQQILITLVADGIPPDMIETSVFYHWLRFTILSRGHEEARFEALAKDMHSVVSRLVKRIREILLSVDDEGPTREMQQLGSMLETLKKVVRTMGQQDLTRKEIERRGMQTTLAVAGFIQDHLDSETNPGLLENVLLYHWLRLSTINGGVDEAFFQKIERNWPTVVDGLHPLIESLTTA